jgi:hypothetical protein
VPWRLCSEVAIVPTVRDVQNMSMRGSLGGILIADPHYCRIPAACQAHAACVMKL